MEALEPRTAAVETKPQRVAQQQNGEDRRKGQRAGRQSKRVHTGRSGTCALGRGQMGARTELLRPVSAEMGKVGLSFSGVARTDRMYLGRRLEHGKQRPPPPSL